MEQNWLLDKVVTTVPRGAAQGTVVAKFTFGAEQATNSEVRAVFEYCSTLGLKSRAVLFAGQYPDRNANAFSAMIRSFADAGITVFLLTDGQEYQGFMTDTNVYTIVVLERPDWASFPCRELHYELRSGSGKEPIVPVKCNLVYVVPAPGMSTQEVMTFIASSKVPWRIGAPTDFAWTLRLKEAQDVG